MGRFFLSGKGALLGVAEALLQAKSKTRFAGSFSICAKGFSSIHFRIGV